MRIVSYGNDVVKPTMITCTRCESVLEVANKDWKPDTYGGEQVCRCGACGAELVKPGTEYRGDF